MTQEARRMTPIKIAMWSGPRNISTAMMRSFENRPDTVVWDEPLYGHYLHSTGLDHPGTKEIIRAWGSSWEQVVQSIEGPVPDGQAVWYQKHMTHHLLPEIGRQWLDEMVHCFLIRDPRRVLASYHRARSDVTLEDLGFAQQTEIFDRVCDRIGDAPIVIDSKDLLMAPEPHLRQLCEHLGLPFSDHMLRWSAGSRSSDGVWAPHWYASVEASTGFAPYQESSVFVPPHLQHIVDEGMPHYEKLYACRLQVVS